MKVSDQNIEFLKLFRLYIEHYRHNPADKKNAATIEGYECKYKKLHEYLSENKLARVPATEFNLLVAKNLFSWLKESVSHNHAVRCTLMCRMVLAFGFDQMIIKSNPLYMFKLRKQNTVTLTYLTPEEVEQLENYSFSSQLLQRVADMFLFQCYTGLDYGDLVTVKKEHLYFNTLDARYYIIKARCKTNAEAFIPYFDKTKILWEKYNYKLPVLCNAPYNRLLKEVSAIVGIDKRITTHVGRKTFTMVKLNYEGYSLEAVSKMSGHKTVKTTETFYAKVNMSRVSAELTRLGIALHS